MQHVPFDKRMPAGWKAVFAWLRDEPRGRRYEDWIGILATWTFDGEVVR